MAAAALATAYVIALVLHLNPNLPLHPSRFAPLLATVGLYYVVHLTVIFYILLVLRQLLAREVFSPAWISVDVLTWLGAMAAAAGAALMWRNLVTFSLVLDAATATALLASAVVLSATAVLCLLLALFSRKAPQARAVWAPLFVLIVLVVDRRRRWRCAGAACRRCSRRVRSTRRSIAPRPEADRPRDGHRASTALRSI